MSSTGIDNNPSKIVVTNDPSADGQVFAVSSSADNLSLSKKTSTQSKSRTSSSSASGSGVSDKSGKGDHLRKEKNKTSGDQLNKPKGGAFSQQMLPGWHPVLTPGRLIPALIIIGLIFVPIGGVILATNSKITEYIIDYTDCQEGQLRILSAPSSSSTNLVKIVSRNAATSEYTISVTLEHDMPGPIFLYYRLTNFYQNNRQYVKSVDWEQLGGQAIPRGALTCDPLSGPKDGDQQLIYYPCGLIANSMFSDHFSALVNAKDSSLFYEFEPKDIAWPSDKSKFGKTKYSLEQVLVPPYWQQNNPLNMEKTGGKIDGKRYVELPENLGNDERFMAWMRTSAFPTFRKPWGRWNGESIPAGTYLITITSKYEVKPFGGTKSLVITNTRWIGGKNTALGILYLVTGLVMILLALGFLLRQVMRPGRAVGDDRYLPWNRHDNKQLGKKAKDHHEKSVVEKDKEEGAKLTSGSGVARGDAEIIQVSSSPSESSINSSIDPDEIVDQYYPRSTPTFDHEEGNEIDGASKQK